MSNLTDPIFRGRINLVEEFGIEPGTDVYHLLDSGLCPRCFNPLRVTRWEDWQTTNFRMTCPICQVGSMVKFTPNMMERIEERRHVATQWAEKFLAQLKEVENE